MPYTEFNPMGNPGDPGHTYMAAGQAQMSLMERAQAMKLREEARQMQQAKWNVEAPVMMAEAQSKLFEYGAQLKERQRTAGLYAEFAQNSDQMQSDFTDAMSTAFGEDGRPDWDNTFRNIQNVRAKWNKYAMLPQAQGWFKNVDLEAKFAFDRAQINAKAENAISLWGNKSSSRAVPAVMGAVRDELIANGVPEESLNQYKDTDNVTVQYDFDQNTNTLKPVAIGPANVSMQGSQSQGDIAMAKEQGQQRAQKSSAFLSDIDNMAEKGRERRMYIGQIIDLYKRGAVTGAGTSEINMIRGFLVRGGLADADSLATDEQVETALMHLVVEDRRDFGKGTGALSDGETRMFQRATANPNRLPAANLAILAFMDEAAQRSDKLQEFALNLRMENPQMSDYEVQMRTLAERRKMPLQSAQKMLELSAQKANGAQRKTNSTAPVFDPASLMQQARKNIQGQ